MLYVADDASSKATYLTLLYRTTTASNVVSAAYVQAQALGQPPDVMLVNGVAAKAQAVLNALQWVPQLTDDPVASMSTCSDSSSLPNVNATSQALQDAADALLPSQSNAPSSARLQRLRLPAPPDLYPNCTISQPPKA